jgi:hypothetical protein
MPFILAGLVVLVQIYFIVHVFRTGRPYWWAFIILSAPALGSLIYFLVEVLPGTRQERAAHKAVRQVIKSFQPDADLKKRAEELEICGSTDNKIALAEECEAAGMFDEAAKLYESALSGPYSQDANIRSKLAHALLGGPADAGRARRSLEIVRSLQASHPSFRQAEIALLEARGLHASGDNSSAIAKYESLVANSVGLEARTRYGLLLREMGHLRQADEVLQGVVDHARRFNIQHEGEQEWLSLAKRSLKS